MIDTAKEEGISLGEDRKEKQMLINMHQAGVNLNTMSQITGLSMAEIKRLLKL